MFIVSVFYYSIRRAGFQPVFFILRPFIRTAQNVRRLFIMKEFNVGIIGATGMVGQRFAILT